MKTNRAVIVQCRLSSTRLPGKALLDLGGKPVLAWVLNSMHKVRADRYFVATDKDSFEKIKPVCEQYGFECFAGSLEDVLKRFCDLLSTINVKTVIRATADNPFLFYEAASDSVKVFEEKNKGGNSCDYLTYSGLPHGSGVEIFSAKSLLKAALETASAYDHEHVGPALYNHKDKYKCEFIEAPQSYFYPKIRTTIDTYSDFLRANLASEYFSKNIEDFSLNFVPSSKQIMEAFESDFVQTPVILAPSVKKGQGTGHLHRCLKTALNNNFFVYIPNDKTLEEADSIIEEYIKKGLKKNQIISKLPDETFSPVIVTDSFMLKKEQLSEFKNSKFIVSIDEGSSFDEYSDYLLDIIPSAGITRKPNNFNSSFIEKPVIVKNSQNDDFKNILVCLGGEDPANLTGKAVDACRKAFPAAKITAITSAAKDFGQVQNIVIEKSIPNLKEQLYKFDLVITHYGLTAYESAYAGCAVVLLPTSRLHRKLAEKYNFACISKKITEETLEIACKSENIHPQISKENQSGLLCDEIKLISSGKKNVCPVCETSPAKPDTVVSRNYTRTYRRCRNCGIIYMGFSSIKDKVYQKSYFFEEYKKQYGKTYEEDFESIKKQCLRRVEVIKSIFGITKKTSDCNVLDIGCAYGPFLAAASESSYNAFGTDISLDAVSYVQNTLHIPAVVSAFPEFNAMEDFGIMQFDAVTMWFVIEHFKNLGTVLKKVNSILKTGGIFAFSTPSGSGISAVTSMDNFCLNSPSDHFTIWEPKNAAKILRKFGFSVEKIVSTGHHPERFPAIKKSGAQRDSIQWKLTDQLSRRKKLGDTVEIYCKKI